MSETSNLQAILENAYEKEKEYDWTAAAEFYKKALNTVSEQAPSKISELHEYLGYALYRFAFQAETSDEFKERIHRANASYEKAKELQRNVNGTSKSHAMLRCDAMVAYMAHWLCYEASEKKRLLDECWCLTKDSLKVLKESGTALEYGRTYNRLSASALLSHCLEWDYQVRKKIMQEVVEHGEDAIKLLSAVNEPEELARAFAKTAFCLSLSAFCFLDSDERDDCIQKAQRYVRNAKEISEDLALVELFFPLRNAQELLWGSGSEEAFKHAERVLNYGIKAGDRFIRGSAFDWLAYHTYWSLQSADDPDKITEIQKKVIEHAEDAQEQYSPISFISPRADAAWVDGIHADVIPGHTFETDLVKKRCLYEKALRAAKDEMKAAAVSGYPEAIAYMHSMLSWILGRLLAAVETNPIDKKKFLDQALEHSEKSFRIMEQLEPFCYWDLGEQRGFVAFMEFQLAELIVDSETKMKTLKHAVLIGEDALKLRLKDLEYEPSKRIMSFGLIGDAQYNLGVWLNLLYELSDNKEHLEKAAELFQAAIESYQKVDRTSRIAECYWRIAQACDGLGEHLNSAEHFSSASSNYHCAMERIPQLKNLYEEHALYMKAWSEIEKARYHHERQEYGQAKEHFEKAADLHKSLKQWSYLTPNYTAWGEMEIAEELSRKEQCEEAIKAFKQGAELFVEAKRSLQAQVNRIENADEKRMATSMVRATELRSQYCSARVALEEARILDKKGDHSSSSDKYGLAAEKFERITKALETDEEKKELTLIATLSLAWQKMTEAEAENSPVLYSEASQLFERAKELGTNERAKMLALGHSRFCRALEMGTRFADTRDTTLHTVAERYLESAADYYVKAGYQNASEYSKAMEHLFDAYVYMDDAKREREPEKKARLYAMTEKMLQSSSVSFMKSEHPEKTEQVQRMLEKVKEDRELALSLSEVFHAPSVVSTTAAFVTPAPTSEDAVGLERFEHAEVQASIIARHRELKVGEELDIEIELVNAGKSSAQLLKITEIIPEGFELLEKPDTCRVEDSCLNMRGRLLGSLKTEDLRLSLRPKIQGIFSLKPTILYLDESGKYKSHMPEPLRITVKELGIKGWIKGDR
jgi:hypothetical protein